MDALMCTFSVCSAPSLRVEHYGVVWCVRFFNQWIFYYAIYPEASLHFISLAVSRDCRRSYKSMCYIAFWQYWIYIVFTAKISPNNLPKTHTPSGHLVVWFRKCASSQYNEIWATVIHITPTTNRARGRRVLRGQRGSDCGWIQSTSFQIRSFLNLKHTHATSEIVCTVVNLTSRGIIIPTVMQAF